VGREHRWPVVGLATAQDLVLGFVFFDLTGRVLWGVLRLPDTYRQLHAHGLAIGRG
jgi:hypothetical protein